MRAAPEPFLFPASPSPRLLLQTKRRALYLFPRRVFFYPRARELNRRERPEGECTRGKRCRAGKKKLDAAISSLTRLFPFSHPGTNHDFSLSSHSALSLSPGHVQPQAPTGPGHLGPARGPHRPHIQNRGAPQGRRQVEKRERKRGKKRKERTTTEEEKKREKLTTHFFSSKLPPPPLLFIKQARETASGAQPSVRSGPRSSPRRSTGGSCSSTPPTLTGSSEGSSAAARRSGERRRRRRTGPPLLLLPLRPSRGRPSPAAASSSAATTTSTGPPPTPGPARPSRTRS